MAQGKKSDGSQFQEVGGGRIKDKDKKVIYSPNQIEQMYEKSQNNKKSGK